MPARPSASIAAALDTDAVVGIAFVAPPLFWVGTLQGCISNGIGTRSVMSSRTMPVGPWIPLPIERLDPPGLRGQAWQVADQLGWAKTYDAEYVALGADSWISRYLLGIVDSNVAAPAA